MSIKALARVLADLHSATHAGHQWHVSAPVHGLPACRLRSCRPSQGMPNTPAANQCKNYQASRLVGGIRSVARSETPSHSEHTRPVLAYRRHTNKQTESSHKEATLLNGPPNVLIHANACTMWHDATSQTHQQGPHKPGAQPAMVWAVGHQQGARPNCQMR